MDTNLYNGANLAFIGDAYYELTIRKYLLTKGITNQMQLHNTCVKYVSRTAQSEIVNKLMDSLSENEKEIFRRGRNYNYKDSTKEYLQASGFEAIIGFLYLEGNTSRLEEIITKSIEIIEGKENA